LQEESPTAPAPDHQDPHATTHFDHVSDHDIFDDITNFDHVPEHDQNPDPVATPKLAELSRRRRCSTQRCPPGLQEESSTIPVPDQQDRSTHANTTEIVV
jgi:hypothetical protein